MYAQQYPNPIRIVSGTVTVNNDDVVLGCDTSTGSVTLNLGQIAQGSWNTNWKLYVYDSSNNAGTNTITINAGSGQKINNANSITINSNGGAYLIRVLNSTSFIASFNGASGGGITQAYQTVQNLGVSLTQRSILNFKGSFLVNAVDNSGASKTDVTIANQYLYARLDMTNPASPYIAPSGTLGSTPRSILNGLTIDKYGTVDNSGITGFVAASGIWTVPTSGYYFVSGNLITRINETDIDSNVDAGGQSWVAGAEIGFMAVGIIRTPSLSATSDVLHSNKQYVTELISDINVMTSGLVYLQQGDEVSLKVLNKTNVTIYGFASSVSIENMKVEFSAVRVF